MYQTKIMLSFEIQFLLIIKNQKTIIKRHNDWKHKNK